MNDELCEHGRPWWPPCARCCLPETWDARWEAHDSWIERIERFAEISMTPLADIEVRASIHTCQWLLAHNKHARLSPERASAPGIIIGTTTGDLLVRRDRNANDVNGTITIIVRGDVVSRIRTQ